MKTLTQMQYPDLAHQRSNRMIAFTVRNHVVTNDAIHQAIVPEVSKATSQKLIVRLVNRGLLKRWPLRGNLSYLRLGSAAAARWQYPNNLVRRLGPQKLPYHFGSMLLTTYHTPRLRRLLPQELQKHFPGFPSSLGDWAYYRDVSSGESKLATIRVEFRIGGDAVVNKLLQQLHDYRSYPLFASLLDESRFIVHVITATPEQEEAIWNAAGRLGFPAELRTSHSPTLTCFL